MMRLIFIISSLSFAFSNVMRYRFSFFIRNHDNITFSGLPVMVLPTLALRRTMFLWTLNRYLMGTVKISMETSIKSSQQQNLAVNV